MVNNFIDVEVVYALPDIQTIIPLQVKLGTNIAQAIEQSGILQQHPDIDLIMAKVGIFSQLKTPSTLLVDGDRVEIYRTLIIDPKQERFKRVNRSKLTKRRG